MKNKFMKKAISLVLVVMTLLSVAVVSTTGASAAQSTRMVTYTLELVTENGAGVTDDEILVNVHGELGETGWVNLGKANKTGIFNYIRNCVKFEAPYVGVTTSIDVKVNGKDGWYPASISLWPGLDNSCGWFIPCGKWIDNGEVVSFVVGESKAYEITVKTADVLNAGTDRNVYATLVDVNGVRSAKTNLSELSGKINAFERGDEIAITIDVPDNFQKLDHIEFELSGGSSVASGWKLESVGVHVMPMVAEGEHFEMFASVNQWGDKGDPIIVKF